MPEKIGPYVVVSELGRGGMGVVYKARDESLNRFVAIKVLGEQLAGEPTLLQRFVREAQAAAGLSHPNIVQIFYIGEDNGHPYFVMEFVAGRSLDQLLRTDGRIDNPRAAQLILQAANGLAAAHDKGIIHRDIKPANLILDDRGLLKIADFGLALPADAQTQLTQTGMFVGTPGYLAPEQVSGEKADNRTDIYALGVTLYLLLTGTPPFRGDSPLALVRQIMDTEPADVTSLNPSVDATTRRILSKMIAKDRAQRYQSCHELIKELEDYLAAAGVRSMTAGLARPAAASSPVVAAAMSAPTQALPKADASAAATMLQPKPAPPTQPGAPLAAPLTQPDFVPPPRASGSRATVVIVVLLVVLLVGGAVGAVMFGTKIFHNLQARSDTPAATDSAPKTAAANVQPAAAPKEGVLLSDAVKLPAPTADTPAPAPAPAAAPVVVKEASQPAAAPVRVEHHQAVAETNHKARAGVAIAATGDQGLTGAVSSVLQKELEAAGVEVVDAQGIPRTEDAVRGGASAAHLIDQLSHEGYAVLVLARIDPTGERELNYYGRTSMAYTSRITLTAYDLATGRPLGASKSGTIEYTSLNAEGQSEDVVGPLAKAIIQSIQGH